MNIQSIKAELTDYIEDYISQNKKQYDEIDLTELHQILFNEDYYIVGYYKAEQWLNRHNISIFEGIEFCQQYEKDNFGECRQYTNPEHLVNMITYIIGEEIIFNDAL